MGAPGAFAGLATFVAVLPVFLFVLRRVPSPVVDLDIFRDRPFTLSIVSAFAMRLMLQNIGIMLGTAVSFTLITGPLPAAIGRRVFAGTVSAISPDAVRALVGGYRHALLVAVCAAVVGTVTALCSVSASRHAPVPDPEPETVPK